jgi:hypothetical protein
MPGYDIELLKVADEAHREAGVAFDESYQALATAQGAEAQAGKERVERYMEAFADGFIIEKVLRRSEIEYVAGYRYSRESGEDEPQWRRLDVGHARSLEGVFATDVNIDSIGWTFRQMSDMPKPQANLPVSFNVAGLHENAGGGRRIQVHRNDRERATTSYSSELSAIQWRLPTEEEIHAFGGLATAATHSVSITQSELEEARRDPHIAVTLAAGAAEGERVEAEGRRRY